MSCSTVASYAGCRVSCAGREAVMCGAVLWLAVPDVVLYSVGCTVASCAGRGVVQCGLYCGYLCRTRCCTVWGCTVASYAGRGVVLCGVVPKLASSYGA